MKIKKFESYFGGDDQKEIFPSEAASKYFFDGLRIWTEWKLPMDYQECGKYFAKNYKDKEKLEQLYQSIIELNPVLKKIKSDDYESSTGHSTGRKYDIIHGVISKFNFDDINFFVTNNVDIRNRINDKLLKPIIKLMLEKMPQKITFHNSHMVAGNNVVFPNYIISPETTNLIMDYLERI